jgi:hypothetical protein
VRVSFISEILIKIEVTVKRHDNKRRKPEKYPNREDGRDLNTSPFLGVKPMGTMEFLFSLRNAIKAGIWMYEEGEWKCGSRAGRTLDRYKIEEFKTKFYKFEGYNPENGCPTRVTLGKMNLGKVADALEKKGRLG